ncbi:MAG: RNA polymerase sigma factor [Ktedonobacterales bacterium]
MAQRRSQLHEGVAATPPLSPDPDSIQKIYADNVAAIYRFIYSKVGNREEAEDLTSQVFIKAIRTVDSSRDTQTVQNWLFQVARTTVADHWRDFYRLRADSLDNLLSRGWEAAIHEGGDRPRDHHLWQVQRILDHLPAHYRDVLTYRFLLGYTIKETAEKMATTEANVKVLQFRALKKAAEEDVIRP